MLFLKDQTKRKLKNRQAQTPRDIKTQGGLIDIKYKGLYLTSTVAPIFYGFSKIHKSGISIPLRPIVSRRVSVTYGLAKEQANMIYLFGGHSPHHLKVSSTLWNTPEWSGWNQCRSWHLIMSRYFSLQYLVTPPL